MQELNLLLEALHYGQHRDSEALYKDILCLIEESRFDTVSRAKIYPKTVYYLCLDGMARGTWGFEEKAEAEMPTLSLVVNGKICYSILSGGQLNSENLK